jgi:hypothetical protein
VKEVRFLSLAAVLVTAVACLTGTARADWASLHIDPSSNLIDTCVTITIDKYGHGSLAWSYVPFINGTDGNHELGNNGLPKLDWSNATVGSTQVLPWAVQHDTGPGGLGNPAGTNLTYFLLNPPNMQQGDVLISGSFGGAVEDVIEANFDYSFPNGVPTRDGSPATLVYFSDNGPYSSPPPVYVYGGGVTKWTKGYSYTPVVVGNYIMPGYVGGYDVTYNFIEGVPAPAAIVLAAVGLGLVGWARRRLT